MTEFAEAVRDVVGRLNAGEVLSYGEVANEAGYPGAARAVGSVLRASEGLPWWRIVASNGRLVPGLEDRHQRLLEAEGVEICDGRVVAPR